MPEIRSASAEADVPPERHAILAGLGEANDARLQQLAELVRHLSPEDYVGHNGHDDTIGAHVRHLLEHYESLLRSGGDAVDYTRRARDGRVAGCAVTALERIETIRAELARYITHEPDSAGARPVEVVGVHDGTPEMPAFGLASSAGRELMFVLSHTVHHMALIAPLARQRGLTVPAGFGVAPSTLRHYG